MEMAAVMRKYSGRLFKSKGMDSLLYEKFGFSFANSDAHQEGTEAGGEARGQGLVVRL